MVEYKEIYEDVKNTLSEERFIHSEGVVRRAIEYAKIYNLDIDTVKQVSIAHDIAKEIPKDEVFKLTSKYRLDLTDVEKINYKVLHGKIGAEICKEKYSFTEEMADAIRYHTTGRENMSDLEKVIYLADATEPGRSYSDLDYYVSLIKSDINQGMLKVVEWTIKDLLKKEKLINIDSIKCYNYYLQIVGNTLNK